MTDTKRAFSLLPTVITLAWPTMLENIMATAVQYIDTAMVGTLGTRATAAVGSTMTINWLLGGSLYAFGVGFLAYISQARGAGDQDRIRSTAAQAVMMVIVVGGILTVLTTSLSQLVPVWMRIDPSVRALASQYFFILYLPMIPRAASAILSSVFRACGDTKTPMRIGIFVNLINVILNFFLIFPFRYLRIGGFIIPIPGADMGVIGAASASAIALTFGGAATTIALYRHPEISPRDYSLKPDRTILLPCLRISLPNMLQRFATSFGYVFFATMINSLGELSTAAHTIANTVESFFYIPGFGMQAAAAALTGNAIGKNNEQLRKDTENVIIVLEVFMMIMSGGLLFVFAPSMVRLFSKDPEVISLCSTILRMVACSEPFFGVAVVTEGMLQGAGKTFFPFVINIIGMWGIRMVGAFICTQLIGMGLVSAWGCMICHNLFLCIVFTIYAQKTDFTTIA